MSNGFKIVNGVEMPLTPNDIADIEARELAWEQGAGDRVRKDRNHLLLEVDAFVGNPLHWGSLDTATQDAWATYRQALLDVPQQTGFPENIIWPITPE